MKLVINSKHGGFRLSDEAILRYAELKGLKVWTEQDAKFKSLTHHWTVPPEERTSFPEPSVWAALPMDERQALNDKYNTQQIYEREMERTDPILIQVVEELGERCRTSVSLPKVVEIPDDVEWTIEEYDGLEWVAEVHRTWS
jgi:hypothetical protein